MNSSSISSLSSSYLRHTPSTGNSSSQSSTAPQAPTFAQMLKSSGGSTSANGGSSTSNPSQLLNQLMSTYQTNGVQNQTQSLDPLSML